MNKEQLLAKCPTVRVTYITEDGLSCNTEAILLNHVLAAFDDNRASDCTCRCGHNCAAAPGDNVHWCVNPDCEFFQVHGHC